MLALLASVHAADLDYGYTPNPGPGETPALFVTPARAVDELYVSCDVGKTLEWTKKGVSGGTKLTFEFPRSAISAECFLRVRFVDGYVEETTLPLSWSYASALSVDLSNASADIEEHTLTVNVTAPVSSAEVVAYGAGKVELDRTTIEIGEGPGDITIPWVGDASDVVLLDVKVENDSAWAGFTFSPWFLDVPHDDVLFESNSDVIDADQEFKLEQTLAELNGVLEKYGDVVPVKLYIAGCTDTVGDAGGNRDLSRRRAKSIAKWLRAHGYSEPIYYHGFGEGLLAVPTGDGVDMQANRRALYLVGAAPPPAGSGIPSVSWTAL
ncbi:MAG: OmpA family protein [Proteobacteria bacterium]|nr:OmpA family protein [Pseudomonadota bacterium]MCP4918032.1 OmpA family protein [Pseudomonadota bacterium]